MLPHSIFPCYSIDLGEPILGKSLQIPRQTPSKVQKGENTEVDSQLGERWYNNFAIGCVITPRNEQKTGQENTQPTESPNPF